MMISNESLNLNFLCWLMPDLEIHLNNISISQRNNWLIVVKHILYFNFTLHIPVKYSPSLWLVNPQRVVWQYFIFPGYIISGGSKMELYNPSSGHSCPVQDLQEDRQGHTSCSGLICGGFSFSSRRSCEEITGTEVSPIPSLTLRQQRGSHLCWSLPGNKIMLLGGEYSPKTTELVSRTSSSGSFDLPYKTL